MCLSWQMLLRDQVSRDGLSIAYRPFMAISLPFVLSLIWMTVSQSRGEGEGRGREQGKTGRDGGPVCLFLGCLASSHIQCVSQGRISSPSFACLPDQTRYLAHHTTMTSGLFVLTQR